MTIDVSAPIQTPFSVFSPLLLSLSLSQLCMLPKALGIISATIHHFLTKYFTVVCETEADQIKLRLMTPVFVLLLLFSCLSTFSTAIDNLTTTHFLKDPESIISSDGNFELGFFHPSNSTNRYVGIWYTKVPIDSVFWVANRNNPLNDSSGVVKIAEDGNLQVLNGRNNILWSSNMSLSVANKTSLSAHLLNSGNLVLNDISNTNGSIIIWQSFDHPLDSLLPNTKFTITSSNMKRALIPWKSPSDPSSYGRFSVGTDSFTHPQVVVWDRDRPHWRSGPWNGNIFLGLMYTDEATNYANTFIRQTDQEGIIDFVYTGASTLAFPHYEFTYDGTVSEKWWDGDQGKWQFVWRAPQTECDLYGNCGAFGTCNTQRSPVCRCLKGFRAKNGQEWSKGNWSSGCVRVMSLQCGVPGKKEDGFLPLRNVKLPDLVEWSAGLNQVECRNQCMKNCSCVAYAYDAGAGCMHWSRDLIDIQEFPMGGVDLYLRLPQSELVNKKKQKDVIVIALSIGTAIFAISIYFLWRLMTQWQGKKAERKKQHLENLKYGELPLFEFQSLVIATSDFQNNNKLGQGGFGQVYKGKLEDGREIAVKRLSAASGQGWEEFMNEVVVISKLQHINLVKLLGCCVEKEEKLLVYEYMPNKSLDSFLFDSNKQKLLNWDTRFNIIEGICRGLVYLHRDSRLRIIHRDLKASNILLDEDLNPKISDFGMARIFSHKQDQDKTRRVVGTYGYMSPEYAMEGHFSEKSDVYSFGVLLLEIVSGKKNSSFCGDEQSLTLLGKVWKLWNEGEIGSIIDPLIYDPCIRPEVLRCIQVGLLCVQEFAGDRPNTSTVLSMVVNDISMLPCPKPPGFTRRLTSSDTESSQRVGQHSSSMTTSNIISITKLVGR